MIPASRPRSRPSRTRVPRQARSEATYHRLLEAAEHLLSEESFDQVTVAEIAARAGVTIGAFYARFADKDALLEAMEDQLTEAVFEVVARATDRTRWHGETLERALRQYLSELIAVYRRTRGAGRALVLQSHTDPALRRRLRRLNAEGPPKVLEFLREQPALEQAGRSSRLEVAFLAVRSTLREVVLFDETWPGRAPLSSQALAVELTRLFLGYLGVKGDLRLAF